MNPYPNGQCTWGAAQMCQCLQNTSLYGNFGNGGDWYSHARSIGLTTDTQPHVGWLCSFAVEGWPDGPGDVGLCVTINPDGSIVRYGTNWHLDGSWSLDVVPKSEIIGCFQPPCSCIGANATVYSSTGQGSSNCITFGWTIFGQQLCFDGIVGLMALGGGLLLMSLALVVAVIGTMSGRQRQQLGTGQPPQEQTPTPETVQTMTPQQRDVLILRARQRATARAAAYRQTQGYRERRVSRMKTGQEQATAAEGTPAGGGARVTNVRLKNRR